MRSTNTKEMRLFFENWRAHSLTETVQSETTRLFAESVASVGVDNIDVSVDFSLSNSYKTADKSFDSSFSE